MINNSNSAVLLLADGLLLKGKSIGKLGTASGEICFNTGMTGYQEVFTDPSYTGQVLIMNNPHIGNYGTKKTDSESASVKISGLILRNFENGFSRIQANESLKNYLENNQIVGIEGIDTRALVKYIREKGAMNCIISSEIFDIESLQNLLNQCPDMNGLDLSNTVSTKIAYDLGDTQSKYKVAVIDFGVKANILNCLTDRGIHIRVFPANSSIEEINAFNSNGYFISNGPGDPSAMKYAVELVNLIIQENKPVFGICLGHQLIALANNIGTYKMHNGHRGLNHPVQNIVTSKCEITTQNHGFNINKEDILNNENIEITHINLNDSSIEGIRMKTKPVFSVQYHPEAAPGPHDSRYLFDDFVKLLSN